MTNITQALNRVLPSPTVLSFYGAELVVAPRCIYYTGPQGNSWAKSAQLAKVLGKKIVFYEGGAK